MYKMTKMKMTLTVLTALMVFILAGFMEAADARSKGGGRSFRQAPAKQSPAAAPAPSRQVSQPGAGPMASPFARGLAGGIMGGFLGSMLFGSMAHGTQGAGGLGGSGIGLFEILLLAGIGYFLYRWFSRRKALAGNTGRPFSQHTDPPVNLFSGPNQQSREALVEEAEDPLVTGVRQIWSVDSQFDPDGFKETAQDLFFKVQAGWTRRDTTVLAPIVGGQLLDEYSHHFRVLKEKGHINRLENIAVRNVELAAAGVQDQEIFVTVRFTANLLDYTVDENTGEMVGGDSENSVKFEENWTFARPAGSRVWKLEGIEA